MVDLQHLKNLLQTTPTSITTSDFIELHKGVEGYIRRLFLIGLRLDGVKYETSLEVIKKSYLNNNDLLKKIIKLISKNAKDISDFENNNPDFKVLLDLFFNFTTVYRNRVVHGVYDVIHDDNTLKHCYYINKYFLIEFEATLNNLAYKSAFDTPTNWGAGRSTSTESFSQVVTRLSLGQLSKVPKRMVEVENLILQTKYKNTI